MAARGNQRHRVWAEFHPYEEVGGQGDVDIKKKTFRKKSERFFSYVLIIIKSLYKKHHLREQ